jgi:nitrogen fixation protein NifQ
LPTAAARAAPAELACLRERYFPGASGFPSDAAVCAALPDGEIEDLLALLLEHRSDDSDETRWLAHAVAVACAGDNHLWQDMGLPQGLHRLRDVLRIRRRPAVPCNARDRGKKTGRG